MAAKRIAKHTVDIGKIIDVVNPWEKARIKKLKVLSDTYVRK